MNRNYWEDCYGRQDKLHHGDCDGWLDRHASGFRPGMQVLDLGCGAGTNIETLLGMGARVSAADLSENAVRLVGERFAGRLAAADCFDMREGFPYPDESFGAVVADLSLHYFSLQDTQRIIGGIRRILTPGGRLIARVHSLANLPADHGGRIEEGYYFVDGFSRRYFTPEDVRRLFAAWKLRSLEETNAYRYGTIKHVIEFAAEK